LTEENLPPGFEDDETEEVKDGTIIVQEGEQLKGIVFPPIHQQQLKEKLRLGTESDNTFEH